jgi:hypothetical protein
MIGSQNNPNSGVVGPKPNLGLGGSNPYVTESSSSALQAQSNQNLQQNVLPGIGQGAQAAGMYGSSRQGIAQGQAIGNAQTGLNSSIANLYSNAYAQDQQAQLQREQHGESVRHCQHAERHEQAWNQQPIHARARQSRSR